MYAIYRCELCIHVNVAQGDKLIRDGEASVDCTVIHTSVICFCSPV